MVHACGGKSTGAGGGGSGSTVNFNPGGGSYNGTSINVTINVTNAAKLRWKIDTGAWTTVNATSTVVNVALTSTGKTLYGDALNSANTVLASNNAFYDNGT